MSQLHSAVWPEIGSGPTVLVPVGSIEQHGPHLPFDTDTVIAVAVANAVADRLRAGTAAEQTGDPTATAGKHAGPAQVWVAPAQCYGSSGEHQAFPGTVSIGTPVLRELTVELTRSLRTWAARVVFVNAHGGNLTALRSAAAQMVQEGHDVVVVPCATEEVDLHAGRTETSLMLHLRPDSVRLDRAEAGNTGTLAELLPAMMAGGIIAVSENGVLGDPAGASAAEGQAVLEQMVAKILAVLAPSA